MPCGLQRFVSGLRQIKNGTTRCCLYRNFMKTMCTYMDRCRRALVIWLWHKFFRLWGKLCAMRWGKIIGFGWFWRKLPPVLVRARGRARTRPCLRHALSQLWSRRLLPASLPFASPKERLLKAFSSKSRRTPKSLIKTSNFADFEHL